MPTSAYGQRLIVVACIIDSHHDVPGIRRPDDHRRALVDHAVVDFARFFIRIIAFNNNFSADQIAEFAWCFGCHDFPEKENAPDIIIAQSRERRSPGHG